MKKYLLFILSIVVALLTWIPNTRLFLTDSNIGTILILVLTIFNFRWYFFSIRNAFCTMINFQVETGKI